MVPTIDEALDSLYRALNATHMMRLHTAKQVLEVSRALSNASVSLRRINARRLNAERIKETMIGLYSRLAVRHDHPDVGSFKKMQQGVVDLIDVAGQMCRTAEEAQKEQLEAEERGILTATF